MYAVNFPGAGFVARPTVVELKAKARESVLLEFNHGLGDAVQLTIVLRHLAKYRPTWDVDVAALVGKHSALQGLCRSVCVIDSPEHRSLSRTADKTFDLPWHENDRAVDGAPKTKATKCLRETFEIEPDLSLYGYSIQIGDESLEAARGYLKQICEGRPLVNGSFPVVAIHYEGNTATERKNLSHTTAAVICEVAISAGYVPLILDWDNRSPIVDQKRIFNPGVHAGDLWKSTGTGDAERLAALISLCSRMIGIDSGPLHVAGATQTPTIGIWTGHHPLQYFDLCPNVMHLVPTEYGFRFQEDGAREFFEEHYWHRPYVNLDEAIVEEILSVLPQLPDSETRDRTDGLITVAGFLARRDNINQDMVIIRDVYLDDCYRTALQDGRIRSAKFVVDVGAHIGAFAKRIHEMNPTATIVCVEACPENIPALTANVGDFATVIHAACTYEEGPLMLLNAVRPNCESTGGSVVVPRAALDGTNLRQHGYRYWEDSRELPAITLEEIIERFDAEAIDILKLDCEGAELSILGKTPSLSKIRFIMGEYHNRIEWDLLRSRRFQGWDYGRMYDGENGLGLFHYQNPTGSAWPHCGLLKPPLLHVAVPAGIGDSLWCLTKIPAMLKSCGAEKAHIALCGGPPYRAAEFIRRFDFVASVENCSLNCVESDRYTEAGPYNWAPSGTRWHNRFDWMLQANRHLESGGRLEDWLPEIDTDWTIADHFQFTMKELREAREFERSTGPFCLFYFGPKEGNTTCGHNRGELWTPNDWGAIADRCRALGLAVVASGAEYDRSYFEESIRPVIGPHLDCVGRWEIATFFAVTARSRFIIGYQSGLSMFAAYMGVPAACFWRPYGDSISPEAFVSFQESMASGWAPKEAIESGRYLPLVYTKCSPDSITEHIERQGWHRE